MPSLPLEVAVIEILAFECHRPLGFLVAGGYCFVLCFFLPMKTSLEGDIWVPRACFSKF